MAQTLGTGELLMKRWHLAEGCAGGAAFALHMMGGKALLPYPGSKQKFRKELEAIVRAWGFEGKPSRVDLVEPGPMARALSATFRNPHWIAELVARLHRMHPRDVYDSLHKHKAADRDDFFAAECLFLQRIAYTGKAVQLVDGVWKSPGYNKASAESKAATDKFGAIPFMVVNLIKRLKAMPTGNVIVYQTTAQEYQSASDRTPDVELIDPPYRGTTGYGNKFPREEVVKHALWAQDRGSRVIVCEAEPVEELVELGWHVVDLTRKPKKKKGEGSPFKGKHKYEFLTVSHYPKTKASA